MSAAPAPAPGSRPPSGAPLAIIVAEPVHARVQAALTLACSAAALGRPARLFFAGPSVLALAPGFERDAEAAFAAAGVPTLDELLASAAELGVPVTACQSGLALTGLTPAELRPGVDPGGMVAFLAADPSAQPVLC